MKTEVTKENCLDLIDRLASKELGKGCEVDYTYLHHFNLRSSKMRTKRGVVLDVDMAGNPKVYFSGQKTLVRKRPDELEILGHPILIGDVLAKLHLDYIHEGSAVLLSLIENWRACGADKSLQSILSCVDGDLEKEENRAARELFTLLLQIFDGA